MSQDIEMNEDTEAGNQSKPMMSFKLMAPNSYYHSNKMNLLANPSAPNLEAF